MSEIPDDIMEAARDLLSGGWPPEGGTESWLRYRDAIARAILDERGRASARIEQLKAALQEAITRMTEAARDAGHWKGKYEAAGYPGTLDGWIEKAKALEAENARLQSCVWRADYLAIAAQKLVDVERTHAGCSGIQLTKLSDELALYWKHAGGAPSARAALARKAGT